MKDLKMKFSTWFYWGVAKFRKKLRLLVAKLSGHGVFDLKHFRLLTNPNFPIWLAVLWIGFDLVMNALGFWRTAKLPAKSKTLVFRFQAETL
jgi:hypothetical protein